MNNNERLLGLILILGGILVSAIIVWVMSIYVQDGAFSVGIAIAGSVAGILFIASPQVGFGIYLLQRGQGETAVSPPIDKAGE